MTLSVTNIIDGIKNATYTFDILWEKIVAVYDYLVTDTAVAGLAATVNGAIASVLPLAAVLVILSVIELFFGKRLLGLQKFLFAFAGGFAAGVLFVAKLVDGVVPGLPNWVAGLATAAVAALLYKLVYFAAYVAVPGYCVYMVFMSGEHLRAVTAYTQGNMTIALICAAVTVLIALLLRKYVEILGTAVLGTVGILEGVKELYDYSAFLSGTLLYVAAAVIVLIGYAFQFKTRKRY